MSYHSTPRSNYFTCVSLWAVTRNKYKREKSQIGAEMLGSGVLSAEACSGSDLEDNDMAIHLFSEHLPSV